MRDIILALIIFGTIPFILMRPYVGLLVWSWIGYMNPHRLCYGFAYNFPWVQLIAVITIVSILTSKESKRIPISIITVLMGFFFAWATITTFFAVESTSAWQEWGIFGKTLIMVVVTLMIVNDRQRMHWLIWVIVGSLAFWGLKGGVFTVLRGGAYHVVGPNASFIANNNDLAQALCMTLPLMRYLQMQSQSKRLRIALVLAMALTGAAILGTYSRGGLIALVVVGGALFLKSRKHAALLVIVGVLGFTAYHVMPPQWTARMNTLQHAEETDSAQTRIQSWQFATNVALHRPLVGGGFNVYESIPMWQRYGPEDATPRAVHSIYFRVLGEQGFVGLVLFLALLLASWKSCSRARKMTRNLPEYRWAYDLGSMVQVSLLAFMIAGMAKASAYFDLSWQLMAISTLLPLIVSNQLGKVSGNEVARPVSQSNRVGVAATLHRHGNG